MANGDRRRARRQAKALEEKQRKIHQQKIREKREFRKEQNAATTGSTTIQSRIAQIIRRMRRNRRRMMSNTMTTVSHFWRRIGLADARPWWLIAYIAALWLYTPEGMVRTPMHYFYWGLRFILFNSAVFMMNVDDCGWFLLPFLGLTHYWLPAVLLLVFYFAGFRKF